MENTPREAISKWLELKLFFNKRIKIPLEHPEFIFYFILIIIGFGGIGIWYSIYYEVSKEICQHSNILGNILSFSIAIIAAGSLELMFVENKAIKNPLLLISLIIIFSSTTLFFVLINLNNPLNYFFVIPIGLLSLFVWWIGNAENSNLTRNYFKDQSDKSKELNEILDKYGY
jgi:hypothetical protein